MIWHGSGLHLWRTVVIYVALPAKWLMLSLWSRCDDGQNGWKVGLVAENGLNEAYIFWELNSTYPSLFTGNRWNWDIFFGIVNSCAMLTAHTLSNWFNDNYSLHISKRTSVSEGNNETPEYVCYLKTSFCYPASYFGEMEYTWKDHSWDRGMLDSCWRDYHSFLIWLVNSSWVEHQLYLK